MPRSRLSPSPYQENILEFVQHGKGHGVVQATAGSGKTTTLAMIAEAIPEELSACFVAFNRHVTHELRERLPRRMGASTLHALGLRTLRAAVPRVRSAEPVPGKYRTLAADTVRVMQGRYRLSPEVASQCQRYLYQLSTFARLNMTDTKRVEAVRALALRYELEPPGDPQLEAQLHHWVRWLLRAGATQCLREGVFDYTDMVYLPVALRYPPPQFDLLLVDEAQDLSTMQLEFTLRLIHHGGRLLYVGDPRQSIYGFAGADPQAIARIVERTGAHVLPLSVTYRCPRLHVMLAQRLAPEIEAAPHAQEGQLACILEDELVASVREGDMVLCRNNAPLVRVCLDLIRHGKAANIQGRDIGRQIIELAQSVFTRGLEHWEETLDAHEALETERLYRRVNDPEVAERMIAHMLDVSDCLRHLVRDGLARGVESVEALSAHIAGIFREDKQPITLSTVHKAKGQEAERVFLLYPHLMPAVYARSEDALAGEACVQFVALTRAKRALIFVETPTELAQFMQQVGVGVDAESKDSSSAGFENPPNDLLESSATGLAPWWRIRQIVWASSNDRAEEDVIETQREAHYSPSGG